MREVKNNPVLPGRSTARPGGRPPETARSHYCNTLLKSIQFLRNYETDRNFYGNVSGYSDLIYSNLINLSRAIPRTVESFMCGIVPFFSGMQGVFPFTELTNVAIHIILVFIVSI